MPSIQCERWCFISRSVCIWHGDRDAHFYREWLFRSIGISPISTVTQAKALQMRLFFSIHIENVSMSNTFQHSQFDKCEKIFWYLSAFTSLVLRFFFFSPFANTDFIQLFRLTSFFCYATNEKKIFRFRNRVLF